MKTIYRLMTIAVATSMTVSCFKDLGNYDYSYFPDFEIAELEKSYDVISFVENLKIVPEISSDLKDFDYVWFITAYRTGLHQREEYADTLSTEAVLDVPFEYPTGTYELHLKVTSRESGDAKYLKTQINAVTPFLNGCYILYETADGNTDMDIHYSDGAVTRMAVKEFTGNSLPGSPKHLSYIPELSYLDEVTGKNVVNYVMIPASENGMVTFNMTDMSPARTAEQWFYGDYDIRKIHHISALGYSINIFAESGVHTNYQIVNSAWGAQLSAGKFAPDADVVGSGAYTVSSDVCYFGDNAFFYDGINGHFISLDYNSNMKTYQLQYAPQFEGELPKEEPLEGRVIFMGGISPNGVNGYSFMEYMMVICERENGSRCWYYVRPEITGLTIVREGEFGADSPFASATHFSSCKNGANYVYAVSGREIFALNPSTGDIQELSFTSLPDGDITYFQTMFNVMSDSSSESNFNNFVIATSKGSDHAVSFYDMIGGIPVMNQGPVKKFEGQGVVKSIQYASQTKRAGMMSMSTSVFSIHY